VAALLSFLPKNVDLQKLMNLHALALAARKQRQTEAVAGKRRGWN
jgi:hypothetical protein